MAVVSREKFLMKMMKFQIRWSYVNSTFSFPKRKSSITFLLYGFSLVYASRNGCLSKCLSFLIRPMTLFVVNDSSNLMLYILIRYLILFVMGCTEKCLFYRPLCMTFWNWAVRYQCRAVNLSNPLLTCKCRVLLTPFPPMHFPDS